MINFYRQINHGNCLLYVFVLHTDNIYSLIYPLHDYSDRVNVIKHSFGKPIDPSNIHVYLSERYMDHSKMFIQPIVRSTSLFSFDRYIYHSYNLMYTLGRPTDPSFSFIFPVNELPRNILL